MRRDVLKQIGTMVRDLRGERSQEEVAEKSGVHRNIISRIEHGGNWEARQLAKLLPVLGGNIELIINLEGATAAERELHERLHELLSAPEPWPTVARFNVDAVYSHFVALSGKHPPDGGARLALASPKRRQ